MVDVYVSQNPEARYPSGAWAYSPSFRYPEYQWDVVSSEPNVVYEMVRKALFGLGLDSNAYGTADGTLWGQ